MKSAVRFLRAALRIRVGRKEARAIARRRCMPKPENFFVSDRKPEELHLYLAGCNPKEPCWVVYAPWGDDELVLRSSRVIFVSKATGEVLYDGSAGDEG